MTNDALINGKVRILNEEEKKGAEEFHRKRLPFIWIAGQLFFNENPEDDRDHQHWVCEDFGLTVEEFEELPRGYILPGRIQLFEGSTFKPTDVQKIKKTDFWKIIRKHNKLYPEYDYEIYNGVEVGRVGEVWPPMFIVNRDWANSPA